MLNKTDLSRRDVLRLPSAGAALVLAGGGNTAYVQLTSDAGGFAFERVTLEMSLKPFRSVDRKSIRAVCDEMFTSWAPLIRHCAGVAVLLWTADGSEILEYSGRMDAEIEWGRYIGDANPPRTPPPDDPNREGGHARNWLYTEHPARITYGDLREIIAVLRQSGREIIGKPVVIGATFDPGGEFARSPFKFERHAEIASGTTRGPNSWVNCAARLKADSKAYAGFPNGIPNGTSFGTFLGRQSMHFLSDLGFDYIWFSNGLGFSLSPWNVTGSLFNGISFNPGKASSVRDAILSFWHDFRKECPEFPIETRGTNLMLGADLSANASPYQDIYEGRFNVIAPPNSPWAAIDGDFGLEIVGYLSRIADLPPNHKFPFRFYIHDPWWLNSPWLDRYGREPHDIYLPLAIARLDGDAKITPPAYLEFLTIDNSYGQMPDQVPNEVIPHILTAMRDYSDSPGIITWICPFQEYHQMVFGVSPKPEQPFFGDWFLRGAVNLGFPLNSVVSTENFIMSYRKKSDFYRDSVLLAFVPTIGYELENVLFDAIRQGQNLLLYGALTHASSRLLNLLNLKLNEPLEGDLELHSALPTDTIQQGKAGSALRYRATLSGGGVDTVEAAPEAAGTRICATVSKGATKRVFAVVRHNPLGPNSGTIGWVRGSFSGSVGNGRLPEPDDPTQFFQAESLMRLMLTEFGYSLLVTKPTPQTPVPLILIARKRNGFFLSTYSPSTVATVRLRFPHGAPLLLGAETWIKDGYSQYTMPRAWHKEVRCCVEQTQASEISCVEYFSEFPGIRRRILIKGLRAATVHFYPEDQKSVIMAANDMRLHNRKSLPYSVEDHGRRLVARNITGNLLISW